MLSRACYLAIVTTVDYVIGAIEEATARADSAIVEVRLGGDVARLTEPKLGGPFDLVYDSKCFHSFPAESHGEMSRAWLNFRGDRMNLWTGC